MQVLIYVLLLLDLDMPETFGTFGGFLRGRGTMIMAFVRIGFRDAQGKQGEREKLENL